MLELSRLHEERDDFVQALTKRGLSPEDLQLVDEAIRLDLLRKSTQTELDAQLAERNQLSRQIGDLFKKGDQQAAKALREQVNTLKTTAAELEDQLRKAKDDIEAVLLQLPNIPHPDVPAGIDESDNAIYRDWPQPLPELGDEALPHWELAEQYNLFDLELGVKITGSGFPVFRGKGARLQRALVNFFLDRATAAGYEEIQPPLLVNEATARATGQLPDKEGQMYYVTKDDLYLIPTAEVPVTNILRDVILEEADFPVRMTGYTPCFRREAGSYGAHVRGLNRVHQFDKVEIVQVAHPDHSYERLYQMVDHIASLLEALELPYRILTLCGGDLGFTSALTYDFEVYSAAQKRWLEVSSVSNFETYQSNRLQLRFRDGKKTRLAHTLNGSALALARIVAALLENNQTADGIQLPAVLHSYTGFSTIT